MRRPTRPFYLLLPLFLLPLFSVGLRAQDPAFLAADLGPGTINDDAFPVLYDPLAVFFRPVELGGRFYFSARHPLYEVELWVSDGTPQGTALLADLCPGPCDGRPEGLRVLGERLVYSADDPFLGRELFALTPGGEPALIADLCPGPCSGVPREGDFSSFAAAVLGDQLFFAGEDGETGIELCVTDGRATGTRRLSDFCPGSCSSLPAGFLATADQLFFEVRLPPHFSVTVARTDGTAAGTRLLRPGRDLHLLGEELFMVSSDEETGEEVWKSDGTPEGTVRMADLCPGACPGVVNLITDLDGRLFFQGRQRPEPDARLYRTDGTRAGTELVLPLIPEIDLGGVLGGELYFFARTAAGNPPALWATDGTVPARGLRSTDGTREGTRTRLPGGTACRSFVPFEGGRSDRLWRSDGTRAGTRHVKNLSLAGQPSTVGEAVVAGEQLFFTVHNRRTGSELWVTNGTGPGTCLLIEIAPGRRDARPAALTAVALPSGDERLLFAADDGENGRELWISDGTATGTRLLADVEPGAASSSPAAFVAAGDFLFFRATTKTSGTELWALPLTSLMEIDS